MLATRPEVPSLRKDGWSTPSAGCALNAPARPEIIPGWNDGTHKWRISIYSIAPVDGEDKSGRNEERSVRAYTYKGSVSTPVRSCRRSKLAKQDPPSRTSPPAYKENELLYPIMQLTSQEKRSQTRIVDDNKIVKEAEVDVVPEQKPLPG